MKKLMIKESIAYISNYFWSESIKNINKYLSESDLKSFSSNDYYYLTTIYYMDKPNFSQLAEQLNFTKPAISQLVKKLSKIGLIEKIQSEHDKRFFFIRITEKGKKIINGDELIYINFEFLIKNVLESEEKYNYIENLLQEIVFKLKNNNK